jgi:glutamate synthase (NADPH/NADH) large chain
VVRHREHTDSAVAARLLDAWDADPEGLLGRFSKVMPTDYKRVLEAEVAARREGRDVLEAIMEASRG